MYGEKIEPILEDIENKNLEIAGGSVVGIVLSTINSLIKYIANLTVGKKNYEDVQEKIQEILKEAEKLKLKSIKAIDEDKRILEEILSAYKLKKQDSNKYKMACKQGTEFCMKVLNIAYSTYLLSEKISKYGNKMLVSDFKICKYYAIASIHSSLENVYINLKDIDDEDYKQNIEEKCKQVLESIQI